MLNIKRFRGDIVGYTFVLPSFIGFLLFMAYPIVYSLFLSFMNWNMFLGLKGSEFTGIKNYKDAFSNEYFQAGIINNIKFSFLAVPLLIAVALIVANLLNMNIYGRGVLRMVYFMPYVATITAAAVVFSALFHPEFGPVNGILRSIGISQPPTWTASVKWALPTVALFWIWKEIGYCIVIFLAGLQGVPKSYYEAARMDGAGPLRQFFHITLPLISPTTFFLSVTTVIQSLQIFPEVQVMTGGGPGTATVTTILHMYDKAFVKFNMGYASAVSWLFFVMIILVTAIQWAGQKKWVKYV